MQQQVIDSCTHPLYEKFKNLLHPVLYGFERGRDEINIDRE